MTPLAVSLDEMVSAGSISEEDILKAVKEMRAKQSRDKIAERYYDAYRVFSGMIEEDVDALYGVCATPFPTPYQALVKKELWESLSDKAAIAIRMIVDSTPEDWREGRLGNILWSHPTNGRKPNIYKSAVCKALKMVGWSNKEIVEVVEELKSFSQELNYI